MFNAIKNSIKRKIARKVTKVYPVKIDHFNTTAYGVIDFANWSNPLTSDVVIRDIYIDFFKQFLKEGDLTIDIGANIGHMTVAMGLVCGKSGLTLAFDPNPFVFNVLSENVKLNTDKTNIKAFNVAITTEEADYYYNSSEASFNNGGISKEPNGNHGKYALSQKIKGINLEKFLKENFENQMANLKLIKIDTEGYDKEIIKSISNLITTYYPVVISECFGKTTPEERFEHFELLKSKGYNLFHINDLISTTEIIPINEKEDMLKWHHFDFYAVKAV